ncbi:hypothetical protein MKEN_00997100 [Mycena kentingensis (nom. inval.)]|nr:hypothetical protein MKEN_00997100 [Mycena kentingensis (nom. inval.)]
MDSTPLAKAANTNAVPVNAYVTNEGTYGPTCGHCGWKASHAPDCPFSVAMVASLLLGFFLAQIVAGQMLLDCAGVKYSPSTATCFNNVQLCPVIAGIRQLPCGTQCYHPMNRSCSNGTIVGYNPEDASILHDCGAARFDPSAYACFPGETPLLCAKFNTIPTLKCGKSCYSPSKYICANETLVENTGPPDCIPSFGESVQCNHFGCFFMNCCPGLASIADHCRNLCEIGISKFCTRKV